MIRSPQNRTKRIRHLPLNFGNYGDFGNFGNLTNGGPVKKSLLGIAFFCSLIVSSAAWPQTFDINGQSSTQQQDKQKKKGKKNSAPAQEQAQQGGGWGGSIEAGR